MKTFADYYHYYIVVYLVKINTYYYDDYQQIGKHLAQIKYTYYDSSILVSIIIELVGIDIIIHVINVGVFVLTISKQ